MQKIIAQLIKSHNIFIASHKHPDGDALGSLLGMGLTLEALKKKVRMYNESALPAIYQFLPSAHTITRKPGNIHSYDTAVILDCSDLDRVGQAAGMISKIPVMINIDHHATNNGFGGMRLVDPSASSTAEIVYRVIKAMGVPIDSGIAYAIYTGIMADTGSFRFSNTTPEAFAISHEMVRCGADPHRVAHHVYETISLNRIKLLNMLFDSIEVSENGRISIMTLTQDMLKTSKTPVEDVTGLINYAKQIENVKLAVLLYERKRNNGSKNSEFHVSLRSEGSVNAAMIAASFGGGGHANAAGFDIIVSLPELKSMILEIAKKL